MLQYSGRRRQLTNKVPIEATISAYGDLATDRRIYKPLDRITLKITGRHHGDKSCRIRVCDAQLKPYYEADIKLSNNRGEAEFHAAGQLGVHWVYLYFPDTEQHSR